jgi:type IV fimbrial biogenesis protein FimT
MSKVKASNIIVRNMPITGKKKAVRNTNSTNKPGLFQSGFTLVEMLVTIAIVGIMAALAAPSMSESIQNSKTKELSGELTVALHLAQSEAVKRGIQVSIEPLQTSGNEWQTGWNIFADPNGNGTQDAGEELIQTYSMPDNGLTLVSKDSVFASWLGFLPSGATKGNGGISGGFRLCRADADISKSRTITMQASGNIIVETGTLSCP